MEATRRQRALRALALMSIGIAATLAISLDPRRALREPAYVAMFVAMCAWTVAENLALRQDEPKSYRGKRGTRMMQASVMAVVLLASVEFFHFPSTLPRTPAAIAAGLVLLCVGAAIRLGAILTLAQHFRYELRVEEGQRIVQRGLYRKLRHPSYLGVILVPIGAALALSSLLGIVLGGALMIAVIVARIRDEERVLHEAFGAEYEAYSARTWRLVPFVY